MIAEIIKDFDIFLISESKLDSTFPNARFVISGFKISPKQIWWTVTSICE